MTPSDHHAAMAALGRVTAPRSLQDPPARRQGRLTRALLWIWEPWQVWCELGRDPLEPEEECLR